MSLPFFLHAAGFALGLGLMSAAQAATGPIGQVDRVENTVTAELNGAARTLAAAAPVQFDEVLRAHDAARLQATLNDDTQITLGENAVLHIDEFVYSPGTRGGALAMRITDGAFLFVGGQVEAPTGGNVTIDTPMGTLGIRGTTVWGGPLEGRYGVVVLDGEVTVTSGGTTVTLTKGLGTMVSGPGTAPEAPAPWSQDRMNRAVATISFQN